MWSLHFSIGKVLCPIIIQASIRDDPLQCVPVRLQASQGTQT